MKRKITFTIKKKKNYKKPYKKAYQTQKAIMVFDLSIIFIFHDKARDVGRCCALYCPFIKKVIIALYK